MIKQTDRSRDWAVSERFLHFITALDSPDNTRDVATEGGGGGRVEMW
jgi:hypothetical protein